MSCFNLVNGINICANKLRAAHWLWGYSSKRKVGVAFDCRVETSFLGGLGHNSSSLIYPRSMSGSTYFIDEKLAIRSGILID